MKHLLNFGCGKDIRVGWDNVDIQKGIGINKSFDFDKFPYPLKRNYYDYVLMKQVLEHLLYPDRVLLELREHCRDKAIIRIETCHYTNYGAYNDMQHIHYFNEEVFKNFVDSKTLINGRKFKIKSLIVTPTRVGIFIPRYIRHLLSFFIGGLQSQIHCEYEVGK